MGDYVGWGVREGGGGGWTGDVPACTRRNMSELVHTRAVRLNANATVVDHLLSLARSFHSTEVPTSTW